VVSSRFIRGELGRGISAPAVCAAGLRPAVLEKGLQVLLETDHLSEEAVVGRHSRIDHPIEGKCAYAVRKEVRVPLADVGAIRKAEVGQLLVSDRDPDLIHVVRSAVRVHEGEQIAALFLASSGKVLDRLDRRLLLLRIVEDGVEGEIGILLRAVDAGYGCACRHPRGSQLTRSKRRFRVLVM
jgi:hypothetical protein